MVLGGSWKKLRSLKLSLCLKVGTPKGSLLSALMYPEVLLPGYGDATRRLDEFTRRERASPTPHEVTKGQINIFEI